MMYCYTNFFPLSTTYSPYTSSNCLHNRFGDILCYRCAQLLARTSQETTPNSPFHVKGTWSFCHAINQRSNHPRKGMLFREINHSILDRNFGISLHFSSIHRWLSSLATRTIIHFISASVITSNLHNCRAFSR